MESAQITIASMVSIRAAKLKPATTAEPYSATNLVTKVIVAGPMRLPAMAGKPT